MRKTIIIVLAAALSFSGCGGFKKQVAAENDPEPSDTYIAGSESPDRVNIYKSTSIVSAETEQSQMDKLTPVSREDSQYFHTGWIKNKKLTHENRQGGFFTPGITYYGDERCKIESVLYVVPGYITYEFLMIFDQDGMPLDILRIGLIDVGEGIHGSSQIEGDTIVYTSHYKDGRTSMASYHITPRLRFVQNK